MNKKFLDKLDNSIDLLILYKRKYNFINNSSHYLRMIKYFFRKKKSPVNCYQGYDRFLIDPQGNVSLCFKTPSLGNLKKERIEKVWFSKKAMKVRRLMKKCSRCWMTCYGEGNLRFSLIRGIQTNFERLKNVRKQSFYSFL
jgi:radical SAM protein with 4Fe4S-binding SPASM domain